MESYEGLIFLKLKYTQEGREVVFQYRLVIITRSMWIKIVEINLYYRGTEASISPCSAKLSRKCWNTHRLCLETVVGVQLSAPATSCRQQLVEFPRISLEDVRPDFWLLFSMYVDN